MSKRKENVNVEWVKHANEVKKKKAAGTAQKPENKVAAVGSHILTEGEMIVQRLNSIATGKAMKYERLGVQQFVPYPYDELTLDNIKTASFNYFKPLLVEPESKICDVLASQNGPSCSKLSHVKNFKVVYVRFVSAVGIPIPPSSAVNTLELQKPDGKSDSEPVQKVPENEAKPPEPKYYPESLSISTMLKAGASISFKAKAPKTVKLSAFDVGKLEWTYKSSEMFIIEEKPFAHGGFRDVYKAKFWKLSKDNAEFVLKKFKPDVLKALQDVNKQLRKEISEEELARRSVQMHMLARNFALQVESLVREKSIDEFGETFNYQEVFFGVIEKNEFVTIEKYISGSFTKYTNNDGKPLNKESNVELIDKAECLSHFSHVKSEGKLLLVDIQGSKYDLYDPEIATSAHTLEDGELKFSLGNLSYKAIDNFKNSHACNKFCKMLNLKAFNINENVKVDS